MTKNREIAEFIFGKMKEFGFEPYDISYGNGYFIFDMGDDSVVHFRVKKVWKHWKFGMWINSDLLDASEEDKKKYKLVSIFAQYDTQIDKFKPSRSELLVELDADEWNETEKNNGLYLYDLESMLYMMRYHPILCYHGVCGDYAGYTRRRSLIYGFIKYEAWEYKRSLVKAIQTAWWLPYTKAKIFFAKRAKCVKSIELYDFEKENPGWSTSYLYEIRITFAKDSTEEKEVKWLNKWFKKDKYGEYGAFDHVIEVDALMRDGIEGRYTYTNREE